MNIFSASNFSPRRRTAALSFCALLTLSVAAHFLSAARAQTSKIVPIGTVRGAVSDAEDATKHKSPFAARGSAPVAVQGIIYQKTHTTKNGAAINGFFLQNSAATADSDPNTSDGIWVFLGRYSKLRDGYVPTVGDEVILSARVVEYQGQTQLSSPALVRGVRRNVALDSEVAPFEVQPPDDESAAERYWERHEGMRARLPASAVALSGRHVFGSDQEAWFARGDSAIAKRADVYARRAFRDSHPLDDDAAELFDNGNGYRVLLAGQNLPTVRVFETLSEPVSGGVSYGFGKYALQVERVFGMQAGADPALNAPPRAAAKDEYGVATYNVENLYDFRNDPNDGCDFKGDSGCPGVKPPFDYVPASAAEYQRHLDKLAHSIVEDLHAPDIVLLEELEDQDICAVQDGEMECGTADNADGRPDVAQELALAIKKIGGVAYQALNDRDGADARGITCGFLVRTERVQVLAADAGDAVLGNAPQVVGYQSGLAFNTQLQNPKALNAPLGDSADRDEEAQNGGIFTRAPQVGKFRIWQNGVAQAANGGPNVTLYAIANHFSSRPDQRLTQRRAQSAYLAGLVQTLQKADPQARVVAGGDLNVYPRPDDPLVSARTKKPSDQLAALYDAGLLNLWDDLVKDAPAAAYSYVYNGQAQTLDHLWNTPPQHAALQQVRVAHINSDWPADDASSNNRRASDHDPVVALYRF